MYCLNNPGNCRDLLGQSTRFIGIEFNCFLGTGVCFCFGRATDDKGNSEWQYSFSVPDPNVGTSSMGLYYLGLRLFSQCTNRDTIYDLYGLSTCRGGSYIIGYDEVYFVDENGKEEWGGRQMGIGLGAGSDALHNIVSYTKPFKNHVETPLPKNGVVKQHRFDLAA